ncbi:thioesterase family protein [Candidatus Clostridium radicumherbarum]|uniref:Thioesterase family protein n=1 Tax=Candidatus Clostridium radicumherbarum TaxID=3381662 RepID=A0ABW8U0D2_9CLOT
MELKFEAGQKHEIQAVVDINDTARFYGSGNLEVFATPAMIALMEGAAKESVEKVLPDGYTTVGIEVSIKHIKATGIGIKVRIEALLEKIEGKRLYFKVEAYDENGKIGEGTHVRYIVNSEDFMKRLSK